MVAFSPVPSMAADLVTTADIANGAVTRPKLAVDSVVSAKVLNDSITASDIKDGTVGTGDIKNGSVKGEDLNLFNDNQCTGETVQATAIVNADPAVPDVSTTDWIGYVHSCSGEEVRMWRPALGTYLVDFGVSNPSRLAVVSTVDPAVTAGVENVSNGLFRVKLTDREGTFSDTDFTILAY